MKNRLLVSFFSSGLQAIAIQILGTAFFFFISLYLSKDSFGVISWASAVSLLLITLLSFGFEQVVFRRIAASSSSEWSAAAYFFHALAGSVLMFLILVLVGFVVKLSAAYEYLPWIFAAQAIIYIGGPLKQLLNAKEKFTPYGIISFISNILKLTGAYLLFKNDLLSVSGIAIVMICCAVLELVALLLYVTRYTNFSFRFKLRAYRKLLKESRSQYISVLFDSSLSRMDTVLLGIIGTSMATADYSFAYRGYDLSRLPIVVIAPLLLARFSRILSNGEKLDIVKTKQVNDLLAIQMFVAIGMILLFNLLWTPIIAYLTHGKYGASNSLQFLILSLCIPLQFLINLLWTLSFAGKNYKMVSTATMICAIINVALNFLLIPQLGAMGAAMAFLMTTIIQAAIYYRFVKRKITSLQLRPLFVFGISGMGVYWLSIHFIDTAVWRVLIAIAIYTAISFGTRQIGQRQLKTIFSFLKQ